MKKEYKYNKGFEAMKDNICDTSCGLYPAPMKAQEALDILTSYLLLHSQSQYLRKVYRFHPD